MWVKGGTGVAARELNIDEHQVVKTLVMENQRGDPVLVLMHGDRQVSTNIYINAGRKGLLARISSEDLVKALKPILVNVAI